jgi:hypothetical protein
MFPTLGEGACVNCGFLSEVSDTFDPADAKEASASTRIGWPGSKLHCFVHAALLDLEAMSYATEFPEVDGGAGIGNEIKRREKALTRARNCQSWYRWRPGFSPQWHIEDRRMRQLEQERQTLLKDLAQMDQRSQEGLRLAMESHTKIMQDSGREGRAWQLAFAAMTVIALILALGSLAYPNGAAWLDWIPGQASTEAPVKTTPTPEPTS